TFNTPVLKDGFLFGLSDKGLLFCLNAKTGETAWTDTAKHDRFGTTLDAGSVLLALVMPGPPVNSELIAFKPSDKQFEEVAKLKVADTPTYSQPVIAGNRIFVKDKENLTLWTLE
ncbi:MAG: PQQ-binding-like beta-propeller repeat protein, partial [Verrucomicrobia bacterium]|nr:PQQ-binding-like beta-propeller repeat protein [Verrucomicrobiota bacterium]